ncbi:MAG: hypothetical protein KGJ23_05040 [Euryarchaeota archaeon]|nr:hypothetical protein [Euryarchaeota archaeon]MDE1835964.1 hypothetical protein [Euryarchaeota archaeon]MDE1881107.1 hypothetical protein [Euryarchaeota archaeon]MDE2044358.1 hypothetical protein [Thermoplasmata archaeon]
MQTDGRPGGGPWATASELGDFAYCRRAWYWKRHPEDVPEGAEYRPPVEAFYRGEEVHARIETVDAMPVKASRAPYAAALLVALALGAGLAYVLGWL